MANYTVLIVDYDPRSIDSLRALINGQGHEVVVAKDGLTAIKLFDQHRPDLVILEAMIPKKHGFEVCQEIKSRPDGKDVPVIIMTAVYRGRKYRTQAFHMYHCDEYLEKPVPDERLLGSVRDLLQGKSSRSDAPESSGQGTALEDIAPDIGTAPQARVEAPPKETPAAKPVVPAAPVAPQPTPEPVAAADEDDAFANITEDDILSRLDEIMPDDDGETAKTAGS